MVRRPFTLKRKKSKYFQKIVPAISYEIAKNTCATFYGNRPIGLKGKGACINIRTIREVGFCSSPLCFPACSCLTLPK